MRKKTAVASAVEGFAFPWLAVQDTTWVTDPANPTMPQTGFIRQGETIWQLARLANQTLCYVQPQHVDRITP